MNTTHHAWAPEAEECGGGKFHACSRPYFCDEFRSDDGDRYIAIQIKTEDLYAWQNPIYPHKIAFRAGVVLHEVDRWGGRINSTEGVGTAETVAGPAGSSVNDVTSASSETENSQPAEAL